MAEARDLTFEDLHNAVASGAAAFRCRRRLQPGGGEGDKVFPPTFAGAVYAVEQRRVPGRDAPVTCVLLDSVQSQANRMELALQEALDEGRLKLPIVEVDFTAWSPTGDIESDKREGRLIDAIGRITSLQVPHRLADAILRDSQTIDGRPFRQSDKGKALNTVSPLNATALYQLCPNGLIFGMWDSTGPKGGLGAKFERAIVSETVGIGASFGVKTASRIDPIVAKTKGIVFFEGSDGTWTLREDEAKKDLKTGKPVRIGREGKASEANLGNVTPAFAKYTKGAEGPDPLRAETFSVDYRIAVGRDELAIRNRAAASEQNAQENHIAAGGVTVEYAEQTTTLSLIVLRRLRFPLAKEQAETDEQHRARCAKANTSGHAVLAALSLCAATLAFESGMGLRSRCLLWPDAPMKWDLLAKPGEQPLSFSVTGDQAIKLLEMALGAAKEHGLVWEEKPVVLQPQQKLVDLVRKSQLLGMETGEGGE